MTSEYQAFSFNLLTKQPKIHVRIRIILLDKKRFWQNQLTFIKP